METIKFSHNYSKLKSIRGDVKLLEVFVKDTKNFSTDFREYDTQYEDSESLTGYSYYQLQNGLHLILLFSDMQGNMFTTVRRHTPEKETYYNLKRGQYFQVVYV